MSNLRNELRLYSRTLPNSSPSSITSHLNLKTQHKISLLENAIYWWVEQVVILYGKDNYRLIVHNKGKILYDKTYKTLRDAKAGFSLKFNNEECIKIKYKGIVNGNPSWKDNYNPEKEWMDLQLKILTNNISKMKISRKHAATHQGTHKNSSRKLRKNKRGSHAQQCR